MQMRGNDIKTKNARWNGRFLIDRLFIMGRKETTQRKGRNDGKKDGNSGEG